MNKLSFYGIGPRVGMIAIPWLAISIFLSIRFKDSFIFTQEEDGMIFYAGLVILTLGLVMYFSTVPMLLKGIKETKLVRKGAFWLCCNPLYASIILLIVPGVSLMMNSWLVLTTGIVAFILFRINIRREYDEMEKVFGDEYRKYREETPEFFPFPLRKLFKSSDH